MFSVSSNKMSGGPLSQGLNTLTVVCDREQAVASSERPCDIASSDVSLASITLLQAKSQFLL